jgi:16S rRNA (guanine966-N2)-methyltransferase
MTRLIAGSAGGRRLVTPTGAGTRPTADRAREGLFSTLESLCGSLAGLSFLDLFAGSGAIGLEAASRGASPVVLVERDPAAIKAIRDNIARLDLPGVSLRAEPVDRVLAGPPTTFDIGFADPPYSQPVEPVVDALVAGGWLADDAVLVVERSSRDADLRWPAGVCALRSRRYGEATLWYGRRS